MTENQLSPPKPRDPPPQIFDATGSERQVIWHEDPYFEAHIRKLIHDLRPDRFIETGTYKAGLVRWMCSEYPDLEYHTIECDPGFYDESRKWVERLSLKNAHVYFGLSQEWLRMNFDSLLNDGKLNFFYLDAHSIFVNLPLRQECEVISRLDRYVCVVDDFLPDPNAPRPGIETWTDFGISLATTKMAEGFDHPYFPAYPLASPFVGYATFLKGVSYDYPFYLRRVE